MCDEVYEKMSETERVRDALSNLIAFLTLDIIAQDPTWGYNVKKEAEKIINKGFMDFEVKISSIYTLLQRLERRQKLIESYKQEEPTGNRPGLQRRWYRITDLGKEELNKTRKSWKQLILVLNSLNNSTLEVQ